MPAESVPHQGPSADLWDSMNPLGSNSSCSSSCVLRESCSLLRSHQHSLWVRLSQGIATTPFVSGLMRGSATEGRIAIFDNFGTAAEQKIIRRRMLTDLVSGKANDSFKASLQTCRMRRTVSLIRRPAGVRSSQVEASLRLDVKVWLREPSHPVNEVADLDRTSRVDTTLNEECPHCGGRLIEKHEETMVEEGKTIVFVHLRCVKCGKWTKRERL